VQLERKRNVVGLEVDFDEISRSHTPSKTAIKRFIR